MSIEEGLRQKAARLLAGITPGPWFYRPLQWDDWGWVRGPADERGFQWLVARTDAGVDRKGADDNEHRRNGTDPYRGNAEFIAACPTLVTGLLLALDTAERGIDILWGRIEQHARIIDAAGIPEHNEHGHAYTLEHRLGLLAEAKAQAERERDWQDIATAPKDRSWFLAWDYDGGFYVYRLGPGLMSGGEPQPTHWQPLPAPPSLRSLEGREPQETEPR